MYVFSSSSYPLSIALSVSYRFCFHIEENRALLLQDKYVDKFMQLLDLTKGSTVIGDKLTRERIAAFLYNLALSRTLSFTLC